VAGELSLTVVLLRDGFIPQMRVIEFGEQHCRTAQLLNSHNCIQDAPEIGNECFALLVVFRV
jgi:hypothetical protein